MKIVILISLIIIQTLAVEGHPVEEYHRLINKSELLICNTQYAEALRLYDKAFQKIKHPFGKDIYNAWVCSIKTSDIQRFKQYSITLIKRNTFLNDVQDILNNIDSQNNSYINIWIELSEKVKSHVDTVYRKRILELSIEDQQVRAYVMKNIDKKYNIGGKDTLNNFDSLNVQKLRSFIIRYGFPTESRIGYQWNYPAVPPPFDIMLLHDRSWNNRQTIDSILYQNIFLGNFHPGIYSHLKDRSCGDGRFKDSISLYQRNTYSCYGTDFTFIIVNDTLYCQKPATDIKKINEARESIYLETLQELIVKADFQKKNKHFVLLYGPSFSKFDELPIEEIQEIKNNSYTQKEIDDFNIIRKK